MLSLSLFSLHFAFASTVLSFPLWTSVSVVYSIQVEYVLRYDPIDHELYIILYHQARFTFSFRASSKFEKLASSTVSARRNIVGSAVADTNVLLALFSLSFFLSPFNTLVSSLLRFNRFSSFCC